MAMWTLLRLTTFDDWTAIVGPVATKKPFMYFLFFAFLSISGLGIMNLIVGIMCNSAMVVSNQDDEVVRLLHMVKIHRALLALREKLSYSRPKSCDDEWQFDEILNEIAGDKKLKSLLRKA